LRGENAALSGIFSFTGSKVAPVSTNFGALSSKIASSGSNFGAHTSNFVSPNRKIAFLNSKIGAHTSNFAPWSRKFAPQSTYLVPLGSKLLLEGAIYGVWLSSSNVNLVVIN
jgi:hypothetical protein